LGNLAEVEFAAGDPEQALRMASEALALSSLAKGVSLRAIWLVNVAAYRIALGDLRQARESVREGLHLARQIHWDAEVAIAFQHLALLAALGGDAQRAARLLGYVSAQYDRLGLKRELTEQWGYEKLLATLRETLSEDQIEGLATEGVAWSDDRALSAALTD
jgi:tetratricopeptide (TPR) repeat protein